MPSVLLCRQTHQVGLSLSWMAEERLRDHSPNTNSLLMNIEILLENYSVLLNIKRLMLACSKGDRTNPSRRAIKSADWECLSICPWMGHWLTFQRSVKGRKQTEGWVWKVLQCRGFSVALLSSPITPTEFLLTLPQVALYSSEKESLAFCFSRDTLWIQCIFTE